MRSYDVVVIGAGIVGLATALRFLERYPRLRLAVVEKEPAVAAHQTGHNSGVIHRGVYYTPGSLKARLCVAGAAELIAFCEAHGVPVERCGKVIVAVDESELPRLDALHRSGVENGVPGLERIGPERLAELEPHVRGITALHSPETAIVDFALVAAACAHAIRARGGEIRLSQRVRAIHRSNGELVIETDSSELRTRHLVACAGLQSDRVAALTDPEADRALRIVPFRGDYHLLRPGRRHLVRNLVYPVPDPRLPFLGVHFTRRPDGEVWAGPNAVLAFAREGYRRTDVSPTDLASALGYRGFWRMALRHWRTGAGEMVRDYVKAGFVAALRRYVPELRADDLLPGPSGVRAQAVRLDGGLVDDFVIEHSASGRAIHVRNAPSPAATSSLAIGTLIVDRAERAWDLR